MASLCIANQDYLNSWVGRDVCGGGLISALLFRSGFLVDSCVSFILSLI